MNDRAEENHGMSKPAEKAALDQWYCVEALQDIAVGSAANRLLGVDLVIARDAAGDIAVTVASDDTPLPTRHRSGYLWSTLGTPPTDLLPIPQAYRPHPRLSASPA